jgi:uncharacterized membrane protein YdbT with pleckstrin-like domain
VAGDYIEESLAPGERVVQRGRWPWLFWLGAWVVLLTLGWLIVGVIWFAALFIKFRTTRWAVTDRRIILKRGLITRDTQELSTRSVEAVQVHQGVLGRLFNYGRLVVTGTGDAVIYFPSTTDPIAFRRAIEAAR